jgi:hypothetical protein
MVRGFRSADGGSRRILLHEALIGGAKRGRTVAFDGAATLPVSPAGVGHPGRMRDML